MPAPIETLRTPQAGFEEVAARIATARQRAEHAVNTILIDSYGQLGQTIGRKIQEAQ